MSDTAQASAFLEEFHSHRNALLATVATISAGSDLSNSDVQGLSNQLGQLSASYANSLNFLPAYDQRLCNQQLGELDVAIQALREKVPKAKFAFKRKTPAQVPTPVTAGSSTAATPPAAYMKEEQLVVPIRKDLYVSSSTLRTQFRSNDILLEQMESCVIDLAYRPPSEEPLILNAVYARNLSGCLLILGIIDGSIRLENCTKCLMVAACRQFRMENCHESIVSLHVSSIPVIEKSDGILVGPYTSPEAGQPLSLTGDSQHSHMRDFSWISSSEPSPNWTAIPSVEEINDWSQTLQTLRSSEGKTGDDVRSAMSNLAP